MELVAVSFLKAVIGYYILSYFSIALVELLMRDILVFPDPNHLSYDVVLKRGRIKYRSGISIITILYFLSIGIYYFVLFNFLNYGVAISALLFMLARIPDLIFEIRTGIKITRKNVPAGKFSYFVSFLTWIAFPILWVSLYMN